MATLFKSGAPFTEMAFCCLVVYSLVAGSSAEPCPDLSWNHTFLDKAYYFLHESHKYSDQVTKICEPLGIDLLVIDSLAENDFIVKTLKTYEPSSESKVFLACPALGTTVPRFFPCRSGSDAFYNEEPNSSRQGFWNWRDGKPDESTNGRCILLNTVDGTWSVLGCGPFSHFVICQCRRRMPSGTRVSTRFQQKAFENKNCLHPDLILRVVPVDNLMQCVMQCQLDGKCVSFNLRNENGISSQKACHLSLYHSSILQETSFVHEENCKYYEMMR